MIAVSACIAAPRALGQQVSVQKLTLGPEQIGEILTAEGITTRVSFQEEVSEIICGDLYDQTSGKGSFVIQRSGPHIFIKLIAPKAATNMFVKNRCGPLRS